MSWKEQPRAPEGQSNGGQWVKDKYAEAERIDNSDSPPHGYRQNTPYDKMLSKRQHVHKQFETKKEIDNFFISDDNGHCTTKQHISHRRWLSSLTPHQKHVIQDYTIYGYKSINSYLRGLENRGLNIDYVKGQVRALDKAIADYSLERPIITYRSIHSEYVLPVSGDISQLIGATYTEQAFMSTSPYPNSPALNKDLLMTIKLPSGNGIGAYISEFNELSEVEFLVARNSKFYVTNAYEQKGQYFVEMEFLK